MKSIIIFLVVYFSGINMVFSGPYDVKYDYDKQTDITNISTFDWMPVPENADIDDFSLQRIKDAVIAELQAKGFTMTSNNPDFLIAEHHGKEDKVQVDNWGYGYGARGAYWGGYGGPVGVSTYEYEEGTLILDFVDTNSKQLIWRGSAKAEVQNVRTPGKSEKLINKTVKAILKKFPPPTKK